MFEAHDLANHYVFWKLNFDGRSERKLKGFFSDSFKGIKEKNSVSKMLSKISRPTVFRLGQGRSNSHLLDGILNKSKKLIF